MRVTDELKALADRSTDSSAARHDEPYRRAITGIYSRLAKTARELDHVSALRQPVNDAPAYASVEEFSADLAVIAHSLEANGGAILARGRLRALAARGRRVRLPSGAARPAAEFRRPRADGRRTARRRRTRNRNISKLDEEARIALLREELRSPRPLVSPFLDYSEETTGELDAVPHGRVDPASTYGAGGIRTSIISKCQGVSDMLELALLLKEVGLVSADGRARSTWSRCSRRSRTCAPASA